MSRGSSLLLLCLTLFLVLAPLAVEKPGLPVSLKADEPAYYLMALSLAHDHDLRCDLGDIQRLDEEYPYLPVRNLILMSDDGWNTVYFGKPYIYSLLAAPAAGLFGANGLVSLNLLLLMAMVWMGASYLARYNSDIEGTLFSLGFFFLSTSFAYAFWLHPEIFNMVSVMTSLYLMFHVDDPEPSVERHFGRWRQRFVTAAPLLSGAVLAFGTYNKPVLAAFALPSLYRLLSRRRYRDLGAWMAGAVVTMALLAGISVALTGHPSAYLGVERSGVPVESVDEMPVEARPITPDAVPVTKNSWSWIFHLPQVTAGGLLRDVGYFFYGRHTGLIPYMPFAVLSVLLFLFHGRRSKTRWLTLAALAAVAAFFLLFIPFNWHGGGGFIGNRYFINAYPAFLFLVTRIRPLWTMFAGYGAGALLVGTLTLTPYGKPVQYPTLQAHVRSPIFRLFPLELPKLERIPGYHGIAQPGAWFMGRKDVAQKHQGELWVHGGVDVELWMRTDKPLERAFFQVRTLAPGNDVEMTLGGAYASLHFAAGDPSRIQIVELQPEAPIWVERQKRKPTLYHYRMTVRTTHGRRPPLPPAMKLAVFPVGVALRYLGTEDPRQREVFAATWSEVELPEEVPAGSRFQVHAQLTNRSAESWPANGALKVQAAYHWLDSDGETILWDGRRTRLPRDLAAGDTVELELEVQAPEAVGRYDLVLDPVYEQVGWFSARSPTNASHHEVAVTVPVAATEATAAATEE